MANLMLYDFVSIFIFKKSIFLPCSQQYICTFWADGGIAQ